MILNDIFKKPPFNSFFSIKVTSTDKSKGPLEL